MMENDCVRARESAKSRRELKKTAIHKRTIAGLRTAVSSIFLTSLLLDRMLEPFALATLTLAPNHF